MPAREGESTILSKEESEALATKKLNLAELAVDHERMNTTTIEQLTHERVCSLPAPLLLIWVNRAVTPGFRPAKYG